MEKNFIDEFIPSKDTRAYLHSIHYEFTDLEKATIVANHIMISYEKKVEWLNSFKEKISNDTLKDRISKALVQIKKDKKYYRKCNTALGALFDIYKKRINRVLDIASSAKSDVIILGAFGCGAFANPPELVAKAMHAAIDEHKYDFETIELAIYCSSRDTSNYEVFAKEFSA